MTNLYNDFEKRFDTQWFSAGWVEVEVKPAKALSRKDLTTLETELNELKEEMENISLKQLRLANLAKMYTN